MYWMPKCDSTNFGLAANPTSAVPLHKRIGQSPNHLSLLQPSESSVRQNQVLPSQFSPRIQSFKTHIRRASKRRTLPAMSSDKPLLDPAIFAHLKDKLEEETQVRDTLTQIVQRLERAVAATQGLLSRVHSTARARYPALVAQLEESIKEQVTIVAELNEVASKQPYYKYNAKWARVVQNAIGTVVYTGWLGGLGNDSQPAELGRLLTLEQVGEIFNVPTNLKDRDAFHLTIEEYLLSLTDLTSELARLATNAVTHGDFELPLTISAFIKDLFAGFQLLNLKNDILRKRADAVKYDVKNVEDVVYDLSLRGLIKRPGEGDTEMATAE